MKNRLILVTLMSSLLLSGCGNSNNDETPTDTSSDISTSISSDDTTSTDSSSSINDEFVEPVPDGKVRVRLPAEIRHYDENEAKTHYDLLFDYSDTYFNTSAVTFNKDLALLSLGFAIATWEKDRINFALETASFDNIQNHGYESLPTTESLGYTFAHKHINDYDLISVSFRGFNYGLEWSNNLKLGSSGNHEGFEEKMLLAYSSLKTYITQYSNIKLWIHGYSRAGAMSNMLSNKILKANEISITEENMFTYTFEAPRGIHIDNLGNYQNIHNIVNSLDLVQDIPPQEYNLYRDGVDLNIYNANVSSIASEFDSHIDVPALSQSLGYYKTDMEFITFFHNYLFVNNPGIGEENQSKTLYTREHFATLYQNDIRKMLEIVFALSEETMEKLKNRFFSMSVADMTALLSNERIFNFLNPIVKEDGLSYNEEEFRAACLTVNQLLELNSSALISLIKNMSRVIAMHYPEITYALLKSYQPE